ncbi:MAG: molybdopterin-dependent oxidoreductase [Pseudomonadales bacterium]|jgi:isoquinoline 1-oxidoreductase beta subunit|nr:molybdopterin-dependent oxidoreductase [Pseudomonadales bacterium]
MNTKVTPSQLSQVDAFFEDALSRQAAPQAPVLPPLNRRQFFKLSGIAGGGLVLGGLSAGVTSKAAAAQAPADLSTLSPYVQIKADGRINIFSKNPECGQGIRTGLPLIIAEELDCAWSDVDVVQADIDQKKYGTQFAGGSTSTPTNWMPMRQAGATARAMILAAAAKQLKIDVAQLSTANSKVLHAASSREWPYSQFAELAATMPVPEANTLTLKTREQFSLLGKRYTGVDNHAIVTGKPLFGADTVLPNMVYASYTKSPQIGGLATSFNEAHIKSLPGVIDAFILEPFAEPRGFLSAAGQGAMFGGVAIVASSTWAAIKAKRELEVNWDLSKAETGTWDDLVARARAAVDQDGPMEVVNKGDVAGAMQSAAKVVSAVYEYPYISHAQLEPETTTALYTDGKIEVWAPSQMPQNGEAGLVAIMKVTPENSIMHQTRIGGGFGRKLANDYVFEAAAIARRMEGRPVKLQWTREDSMTHDYYRPGGLHSYKGALDGQGNLTAWQDHFFSHTLDGKAPMFASELSPTVFPQDVLSNVKVTQTLFQNAMPVGPMRAPSSNAFGFTFQSFLHELAVAAGKDHLQFLLGVLGEPRLANPEGRGSMHTGRARNVISAVAERAGWGKQMPPNRALGLSFYFSHSGYVAQVADVEVNAAKEVKVHKIWAVADFGFIHNMSAAESQLEGGMIDGLSQLFNAKITFNNGVIQQQNFHQYPLLRLPFAPQLDTHFLQPDEFPPTGAGEPSVPPLLAAVTNAIFNATGERIRKLPLSELGYKLV